MCCAAAKTDQLFGQCRLCGQPCWATGFGWFMLSELKTNSITFLEYDSACLSTLQYWYLPVHSNICGSACIVTFDPTHWRCMVMIHFPRSCVHFLLTDCSSQPQLGEGGGAKLSCWQWSHLLNFSCSHPPAQRGISKHSSTQQVPWHVIARCMIRRLPWRNGNRSYELRMAVCWASPNDRINGWLSAPLLGFFLKHNAIHSCEFNGFWTTELHRMLEATDVNKQPSMLGKHAVSGQKAKTRVVGRGATCCNWHWPPDPPDGLPRHNITPWSIRVKQAQTCRSLTLKYHKSMERDVF